MGLMDRDYWKEKHNPNWNKNTNKVNPRHARVLSELQNQIDKQINDHNYTYNPKEFRLDQSSNPVPEPSVTFKIEEKLKALVQTILISVIAIVLFLVYEVPTEMVSKKNNNFFCNITALQIDSNNDGKFSYNDIGINTLNIFLYPYKITITEPKLKPLIEFFEFENKTCKSVKIFIYDEFAVLLCIQAFLITLSVVIYLTRFILKKIIFDLIKLKPFTKITATLFRHIYPAFEFFTFIPFVMVLTGGICLICILKFTSEGTNLNNIVFQLQFKN